MERRLLRTVSPLLVAGGVALTLALLAVGVGVALPRLALTGGGGRR